MAIRATCDSCFMEYKVPDAKAGKAFKCKECGGVVRVPRQGASAAAPKSAAAPPPRQRPQASGSKKSSTKKKHKSSSNGLPIGPLLGGLAVVAVAIGGYVMFAGGGGDAGNAGAAGDVAGGGATEAPPPLSADEEVVLREYQEMVRAHIREKTPIEQRKTELDALAKRHNMTATEVMEISKQDREARKAANRVATSWQPLQLGRIPAANWPTDVNVSVPVGNSAAVMSVPQLRTPYLLASASGSPEASRSVFDLSNSQQIGSWTKKLVPSGNEQLSRDGKLVCLQEGFKPPIRLHVVDAASGNTVQTISSPDIHRVAVLAFVGPKQLFVMTPPTAERSRSKAIHCLTFDATSGQEVSRFEREFAFSGKDKMSLTPDGKYLVAAGRGKSIEVIQLADGKTVCELDLQNEGIEFGQIHSVAVSHDGQQIAVLEQKPLTALRLYIVDSANGTITKKIDLYGGINAQGGALETQNDDPLLWFPDGRHVLIGRIVAVDLKTGRRVWHARGKQVGNYNFRLPTRDGVLYQVNAEKSSSLVSSPIDFARISAAQSSPPADAILAPGATVGVSVDLAAAGLESLNDIATQALQQKLEGQGFTVAATADIALHVRPEGEFLRFAWTSGDGSQTYWESVSEGNSAMLSLLGHQVDKEPARALASEGIARLLAYPTPWLITADGWSVPVVADLDHGK